VKEDWGEGISDLPEALFLTLSLDSSENSLSLWVRIRVRELAPA